MVILLATAFFIGATLYPDPLAAGEGGSQEGSLQISELLKQPNLMSGGSVQRRLTWSTYPPLKVVAKITNDSSSGTLRTLTIEFVGQVGNKGAPFIPENPESTIIYRLNSEAPSDHLHRLRMHLHLIGQNITKLSFEKEIKVESNKPRVKTVNTDKKVEMLYLRDIRLTLRHTDKQGKKSDLTDVEQRLIQAVDSKIGYYSYVICEKSCSTHMPTPEQKTNSSHDVPIRLVHGSPKNEKDIGKEAIKNKKELNEIISLDQFSLFKCFENVGITTKVKQVPRKNYFSIYASGFPDSCRFGNAIKYDSKRRLVTVYMDRLKEAMAGSSTRGEDIVNPQSSDGGDLSSDPTAPDSEGSAEERPGFGLHFIDIDKESIDRTSLTGTIRIEKTDGKQPLFECELTSGGGMNPVGDTVCEGSENGLWIGPTDSRDALVKGEKITIIGNLDGYSVPPLSLEEKDIADGVEITLHKSHRLSELVFVPEYRLFGNRQVATDLIRDQDCTYQIEVGTKKVTLSDKKDEDVSGGWALVLQDKDHTGKVKAGDKVKLLSTPNNDNNRCLETNDEIEIPTDRRVHLLIRHPQPWLLAILSSVDFPRGEGEDVKVFERSKLTFWKNTMYTINKVTEKLGVNNQFDWRFISAVEGSAYGKAERALAGAKGAKSVDKGILDDFQSESLDQLLWTEDFLRKNKLKKRSPLEYSDLSDAIRKFAKQQYQLVKGLSHSVLVIRGQKNFGVNDCKDFQEFVDKLNTDRKNMSPITVLGFMPVNEIRKGARPESKTNAAENNSVLMPYNKENFDYTGVFRCASDQSQLLVFRYRYDPINPDTAQKEPQKALENALWLLRSPSNSKSQ